MKRRARRAVLGIVIACALAGGVAFFFQRRLHKIVFIAAPPSRSMSTEGWSDAAPLDSVRVLFVGHSLIGTEAPAMAGAIARSLGTEWSHDVQLTDGGSLEVNWNHPSRAAGVHAADALESGEYDALVLTEAVILDDHLRWSQSSRYAERFFQHALDARADTRLFFFEGWHDREAPRVRWGMSSEPAWRTWLDEDLGKWESIVDGTSMGRQTQIIPGGQAMAALHDALEAGELELGLDAFFRDGVHLSSLGSYYLALVHVSAITHRSPVGATNQVPFSEGELYEVPPATARVLQDIAWRSVRGYARSGVLVSP